MSPRALLADDALRSALAANLARFERAPLRQPELRAAAVAVVICSDTEGRAAFVITRRAARMREHAGQWALPGGRIDPGEDAIDTAVRELREEVGLCAERSDVLGMLDDYPTRSGYAITPVVVWQQQGAQLAPNPHEVAAAYRVPLEVLGRPEVPRLVRIPESERPVIQVPIAQLETSIHAPTAAILYQLWEVAVSGRDTRVADYEQPVFAWR